MKPLKIQKEKQTIDNEKQHNKILFELGILDDMEDWPLYQKQENILNENIYNMETEEYFRLIGKEYIPSPKPVTPMPRPKNVVKPNKSLGIK